MDEVKDGILFDVEHNSFWPEEWGVRPEAGEDALAVATRLLGAAFPMIPVFAHRRLPAERHRAGNPVLSLHQTDVIYYGCDLEDYLRHEFQLGGRREWPDRIPAIPFWSLFL